MDRIRLCLLFPPEHRSDCGLKSIVGKGMPGLAFAPNVVILGSSTRGLEPGSAPDE